MGELFNNPFLEALHCGTESPIDNACNSPITRLVRDNMVYLRIHDQHYFEIPEPNGLDYYPDCTLANFYRYTRVDIQKLHDICPNHISRLRESWLYPVSLFEKFEQTNLFFTTSTNAFDENLLNASMWISQETYQKGTAIYGACPAPPPARPPPARPPRPPRPPSGAAALRRKRLQPTRHAQPASPYGSGHSASPKPPVSCITQAVAACARVQACSPRCTSRCSSA